MSKAKTNKKITPKWFYLIVILIPIIFILSLEGILRLFNYGNDYLIFVKESDDYPEKLILNPELPSKYFFNLKKGPGTVPDAFDKIKKDNTFRVFVLGESSAAGWPFIYNASFSANLRRRLELLYPENTIEVINCGISAINTFTIRDIVPGIIGQKPDLILIYTGHNEYYGALGVGSTASLGNSRTLINFYLWLINFKTVQLFSNIVSGISSLFSEPEKKPSNTQPQTLMSAMIEESLIPLNSGLYNSGIEQFEGNIKDILEMFRKENIQVILGTLTCNTKDLKPFVSVNYDNLPTAEKIYDDAIKNYKAGNISKANELFSYAKDLDALRFRAPTEINKIIKKSAGEFNYSLIDIDSVFRSVSPDGIVGKNIMLDHVHPTVEGYRLIGESFFLKMEASKYLPNGRRNDISLDKQDSILTADFPFTPIDSVLAYLRLIQLMGAYPFISKDQPNNLILNFQPENFVDSIALKVLHQDISWGEAHVNASLYYYRRKEYDKFTNEMDALIAAKPFDNKFYEQTITMLTEANLFNEAVPYLKKLHSSEPSLFSTKWLGQISLQNKNYEYAEKYLEESLSYSDRDYQIWYNLAGIYYYKGDFEKSLSAVERSLSLNPDYHYAKNIYRQLKSLIQK